MDDWSPGLEGPEMEWKLRLPRNDRIATTLAAFANGCGGTVIVGVRDSGEVQGVRRPAEVESELRRVSTELIDPPIRVEISRRSRASKDIVLARVRPSQVLAAVLRGPERIIYVRDGSSTRKATSAEAALLARGPSAGVRLDKTALRLLAAVTMTNPPTVTTIARAVKMGQRGARRVLVRLMQAGLVMERGGGRFWLTPRGHRRLVGRRGS